MSDLPSVDPNDNPYLIKGPALISFSGGRTSGYMLWRILQAHDGALPDDVHVCFANTGKEREETLRFVHDVATRWNVKIRWLERRSAGRGSRPSDRFAEVGYNSASRNGEPFSEIIRLKQYLPNSQMRYCTIELKIRTMLMFMKAQGYKRWINAVGLRGDEMRRVFKAIERNESGKEVFTAVMPMATQKGGMVRKSDVMDFWKDQPFDLGLAPHEGNCDLCFLKSRPAKIAIIRELPDRANWWEAEERTAKCSVKINGQANARFISDESMHDLRLSVERTNPIPLGDEEFDAECGLWC